MKVFVLTLAVLAAPASAFAMCNYGQQAMSCAAGTTYDAASGTCVTTTS
ncbi:MAG: carbohydrate-binding module family 14 protein [Pseudomonadota bacterium]